ncbi:hypothetical protein Aph01nite_21020 [Acrocarpospora phusangensis]|uniref:Lipoprotein n=1 Tax=Acrocarpospora phusangensis TaxID=1070424 RepID=A0A919UMV9_9ACTN|nr:hypothetical protein [Acrocarpospora phusangensis]GIH23792.1 hypothetical protein Aph01nite_21020 [Acrocarpospora phusangensis]
MITPRFLAVAAAAVTLAACTAAPEPPPGSGGSSQGAAGSPQPSGLSPAAYRTALDAAGGPVDTALKDLAKANTPKTLSQRLTKAETAVGAALTQLRPVQPPADITTEHSDYLAALSGVETALGDLRTAVQDSSLCTATAVLAKLGKSDDFAALKEAGVDLASLGDYPGGKLTVKPPKEQNRRQSNGKVLRSAVRGGRSKLIVKNGGAQDAVLTMMLGKRKAVSVYVRKKSRATVANIKDGNYRVFFATGVDYDSKKRRFNRTCGYERFDDPVRFKTTFSGSTIRWSDWTLTLNKVTGGNAPSSRVDPEDFPI